MQFRRRRRHSGPTPLADLAHDSGLVLTTRKALGRSVVDVAFDEFIFSDDVLSTAAATGPRSALERGRRADGITLTVGSVAIPSVGTDWIAVQSARGGNHLQLDVLVEQGAVPIGHERFDALYTVDADSVDLARSVLDDEVCDWLVSADSEHGPLIVLIDAGEAPDVVPGDTAPDATLYVARVTADDDAFVATLEVMNELANAFRSHLATQRQGFSPAD